MQLNLMSTGGGKKRKITMSALLEPVLSEQQPAAETSFSLSPLVGAISQNMFDSIHPLESHKHTWQVARRRSCNRTQRWPPVVATRQATWTQNGWCDDCRTFEFSSEGISLEIGTAQTFVHLLFFLFVRRNRGVTLKTIDRSEWNIYSFRND